MNILVGLLLGIVLLYQKRCRAAAARALLPQTVAEQRPSRLWPLAHAE
jgi:hypothetical protein